MKKFISFVSAAVIMGASLCSCGQPKKNLDAVPEENPAVSQHEGSYEDALKECFNASFSTSGGEIFYSYMYPDAYVQDMKDKGDYNAIINNFNENQKSRPDLTDNVYAFGTIKEAVAINDKQTDAVKSYFVNKCTDRIQLTEDDIDVKEGYEISYTYTQNGEEGGNDAALAVKIGNEGWKVIPS